MRFSNNKMANSAILCVDDESVILRSLRDQIGKFFGAQFQCEIAESVDEAWEVIDELKEDDVEILIIISDWLMPGTKGDEFLIELNQKFPDIVTVLLSGQADESAIERIYQQTQLHAYVTKPWNEEDLMQVISTGLDSFQS